MTALRRRRASNRRGVAPLLCPVRSSSCLGVDRSQLRGHLRRPNLRGQRKPFAARRPLEAPPRWTPDAAEAGPAAENPRRATCPGSHTFAALVHPAPSRLARLASGAFQCRHVPFPPPRGPPNRGPATWSSRSAFGDLPGRGARGLLGAVPKARTRSRPALMRASPPNRSPRSRPGAPPE